MFSQIRARQEISEWRSCFVTSPQVQFRRVEPQSAQRPQRASGNPHSAPEDRVACSACPARVRDREPLGGGDRWPDADVPCRSRARPANLRTGPGRRSGKPAAGGRLSEADARGGAVRPCHRRVAGPGEAQGQRSKRGNQPGARVCRQGADLRRSSAHISGTRRDERVDAVNHATAVGAGVPTIAARSISTTTA